MSISYIKGDATRPVGDGQKIIAHICNDAGAWGAGFVLAISKRWATPEQVYRRAFRTAWPALGDIQIVPAEPGIIVCNMIAQSGINSQHTTPPIRYEALRECLAKVSSIARKWDCSVHMPRIGCGLGGGNWDMVEPIINAELSELTVTVYDL